jgi:hypothetical protein
VEARNRLIYKNKSIINYLTIRKSAFFPKLLYGVFPWIPKFWIYVFEYDIKNSQDIVAELAAGLRDRYARNLDLFQSETENFLSSKSSRLVLGPNQPLIQ